MAKLKDVDGNEVDLADIVSKAMASAMEGFDSKINDTINMAMKNRDARRDKKIASMVEEKISGFIETKEDTAQEKSGDAKRIKKLEDALARQQSEIEKRDRAIFERDRDNTLRDAIGELGFRKEMHDLPFLKFKDQVTRGEDGQWYVGEPGEQSTLKGALAEFAKTPSGKACLAPVQTGGSGQAPRRGATAATGGADSGDGLDDLTRWINNEMTPRE